MEHIEADLLIPGKGEPIRDGVVVLDGPTITYAGPAADAPSTGQAPSTRAMALLPGLWDCHGHLMGARSLDLARLPLEPIAHCCIERSPLRLPPLGRSTRHIAVTIACFKSFLAPSP